MAYMMDIAAPPPSPIKAYSFMEQDTESVPKEIWSGKKWYSSIRKNGQRAVCVKWEDTSMTIEPVCNMIDFETKEITEKMIPVLYNWDLASKTLRHTCKCAFCNEPSDVKNFMCSSCDTKASWLKPFIYKEKEKRENIYISDQSMKIYEEDNYSHKNKIQRINEPPKIVNIKVPEKWLKRKHGQEIDMNDIQKIFSKVGIEVETLI